MSFDLDKTVKDAVAFSLNPFRAGRCLSTNKSVIGSPSIFVSIPFEQGDVFRRESEDDWIAFGSSQSLSSRAMSFDFCPTVKNCRLLRLNPFRAGRCLSTIAQDNVLLLLFGLNPFRAGRCLSTAAVCWRQESCGLSDPLPNFFGRLRSWLLI